MYPIPAELPAELPLFPLPGVLLLPGGRLPLNIFEPRYLGMVNDALGSGRLIGMIQPQDNATAPTAPALYAIGCAGRIVHFEETPDGRFLITLLGLSRFRMTSETATVHPYRRACVAWDDFSQDLLPVPLQETPQDRQNFMTIACRYLERQGMSFEREAIAEAPLDRLSTAIAMICPFSQEEKQALLEAPDAAERKALLLALMEMALYHVSEGCGRPHLN
jgi:Lon protease-like protein